MGLWKGIANGIGAKKRGINWSSYWTKQSLFFLDGTITDVGGTKYFVDKSTNGRNFLITGYDFATDWTTGFPYKSAATISAPAADAALIAADINNFLYDAGGTPNQIPVVSLFQDIDYEHKIFCKHEGQVVDVNGIETSEPYVSYMFMAQSVLTGADLAKAQIEFSVPSEIGSAYWVTTAGNDTTGNGSKATPWATIGKANTTAAAGSTIYVKTGVYLKATVLVISRDQDIIGLGRCELTNGGTYVLDLQETSKVIGFILNATATQNNAIILRGGGTEEYYLDKIYSYNSNQANILTNGTWVSATIKNSIIRSTAAGTGVFYGLTLDTSYVSTLNFFIPAASTEPIIKNNRLTSCAYTIAQNAVTFIGNKCFIVTGNVISSSGAATSQKIWTVISNIITYSNITSVTQTIDVRGVNYELLASYNKFYYLSTNAIANVGAFIYTSDVNRSEIEHNKFIIRSKSQFYCVRNHVTGTVIPSSPYKLNYNYVESDALVGSELALGEELTAANILDNSEVIGNTCIGFKKTYPSETGTLHHIFVNNGIDIDIRANYVSHSVIGICVKAGADGSGYTSKGVQYNIINECSNGILIKGVDGIKVFNNTVYHSNIAYTKEFEYSFSCLINGVDQRVEMLILKII
jgi:hypothetical protein